MHVANPITVADVRAALAYANIPIYIICAKVRLHPVNLSKVLNNHMPLKSDLARRIMAAIDQEVAAR